MLRPRTLRIVTPLFPGLPRRAPFRRNFYNATRSEDVTVQRVKFQNRAFTFRRVLTPLVYAGTAYIVTTVLTTLFLRDDSKTAGSPTSRNDSPGLEEEEWDEDDNWFIPLGLWAKERPREFYRGSDPEWQDFVRFSKDSKRHQRVRDQLVTIMRKNISNDSRFKHTIGTVDVTAGKYWLDIIFPPGPPLEYERSGLEVAPDTITWTTRTVTSRNYQRFNKIVWPHAAFFGVYQSGKHLFQHQYKQVRQLLGFSDEPDQNPPTVQDALRKLASPATDGTESTQRTASSATKASPSRTSQPASSEKNLSNIELISSIIDITAFHHFIRTFVQRWKGYSMEPPRGSIVLRGLIAVQGDKGRMTLNVTGFYDPKTDKFVGLGAQVNSMQPRHQRPKGGP